MSVQKRDKGAAYRDRSEHISIYLSPFVRFENLTNHRQNSRKGERQKGMGANLSIQQPARHRDECSRHGDHHCRHCCSHRRRRREAAKRDDAPINQLISAAVDYLRAEIEIRKARREGEVWDEEEKVKRGRRRRRRVRATTDWTEDIRDTADRDDGWSRRSPSAHSLPSTRLSAVSSPARRMSEMSVSTRRLPREPSPMPEVPPPSPPPSGEDSRFIIREDIVREETGMDPLPPPVHRPQVNEARKSPLGTPVADSPTKIS